MAEGGRSPPKVSRSTRTTRSTSDAPLMGELVQHRKPRKDRGISRKTKIQSESETMDRMSKMDEEIQSMKEDLVETYEQLNKSLERSIDRSREHLSQISPEIAQLKKEVQNLGSDTRTIEQHVSPTESNGQFEHVWDVEVKVNPPPNIRSNQEPEILEIESDISDMEPDVIDPLHDSVEDIIRNAHIQHSDYRDKTLSSLEESLDEQLAHLADSVIRRDQLDKLAELGVTPKSKQTFSNLHRFDTSTPLRLFTHLSKPKAKMATGYVGARFDLFPKDNIFGIDIDTRQVCLNYEDKWFEENWFAHMSKSNDCHKNNWPENGAFYTQVNGCTCICLTDGWYPLCNVTAALTPGDKTVLKYHMDNKDNKAVGQFLYDSAKSLGKLHQKHIRQMNQDPDSDSDDGDDEGIGDGERPPDPGPLSDAQKQQYHKDMITSLKNCAPNLPKFVGAFGANPQTHIYAYEGWVKNSMFRLGDDDYNRYLLAQLFQLSLLDKALQWFVEKNMAKKSYKEIKKAFLEKFSPYGETRSERNSRYMNYTWDPLTKPVDDMIREVKTLGESLKQPEDGIVDRIKNLLHPSIQNIMIHVTDFDTLEKYLRTISVNNRLGTKETNPTATGLTGLAGITPPNTSAVASAQDPGFLLCMQQQLDKHSKKHKSVSFQDTKQMETFNQVMSKLDNVATNFGDTMNQITQEFDKLKMRDRDRSRDRDNSKSGFRDGSRDRSKERYDNKFKTKMSGIKCNCCGEYGHMYRQCEVFKKCIQNMQNKGEDPNDLTKKTGNGQSDGRANLISDFLEFSDYYVSN